MDKQETDLQDAVPAQERQRKPNWKALELLLFVALVLGFGSYQFFSSQGASAQNGLPPEVDPHGIRIAKYANPAEGTDFIFNCEDEDLQGGPGCPSAAFTLSDTDSGTIDVLQYTDIISPNNGSIFTITEQVPQGWVLYDIDCIYANNASDVTEIADGVQIDYNWPGEEYGEIYCNFYNAIPSAITIVKNATPAIGVDYQFTGTFGSFMLDDAVPDDGDALTDSRVFTGLIPGSYNVLEINGSRLEGIMCEVNGQPVTYGDALLRSLSPLAAGLVYTSTSGLDACPGCGAQVYWSDTREDHGIFEYELPGSGPPPFSSAIFALQLNDDQACLPAQVEVYGFAGDGSVTTGDFDAGTLLQTVDLAAEQEVANIDATGFISGLLDASETYAGFNLRYAEKKECTLSFDSDSRLDFYTPWGVQVALEGDQDAVCTFTNKEPAVRINVKKVVLGSAPGSAWQYVTRVDGGSPAQDTFTLAAAGGTHTGQAIGLASANATATVTETTKNGYFVESTCDNGATGGAVLSFPIAQSDDVTCTFTNTRASRIIVDKVTDPSGSSQSFDFTLTGPGVNQPFTLTNGAVPYDSGELLPGTYAVNETVPAGWTLAEASCIDGDGTNYSPASIALPPGTTVTCTFTNKQLPEPVASATVTKTVGTDGTQCGASQRLEVKEGTEVYFCFTLENTGNVTLTEHTLIDQSLNTTVTLTYDLGPGQQVEITNAVLKSLGKPEVLGPVTVTERIVNTVLFEASDGVETVSKSSTARVVLEEEDEEPNGPLFLPQVRG